MPGLAAELSKPVFAWVCFLRAAVYLCKGALREFLARTIVGCCCRTYSSHTSGVRIIEDGNQGCRYAPPLATVRAAFQAAFGTLKACQEGSLACEQSEPRQVYRATQAAPREGCEDPRRGRGN